MAGTTNEAQIEHRFCTKDTTDTDTGTDEDFHWPPGQYCIFRKGGECPKG